MDYTFHNKCFITIYTSSLNLIRAKVCNFSKFAYQTETKSGSAGKRPVTTIVKKNRLEFK